MTSRRDFLKTGMLSGAGLTLPLGLSMQAANAAPLPPGSPPLTKFSNQLPANIPKASIDKTNPALWTLSLAAANAATYNFHDNTAELGPVANTFGYGGAPYLGPTIEARRGIPLRVTLTNNLGAHPLANWISTANGIGGIQATDATAPRISTHLHGGYTEAASDGGPLDWFSPGNFRIYNYANDQQSATLWYHDHAIGITRLNVYAGLAGMYLLRDEFDTGLPYNASTNPNQIQNLPVGYGTYEIPLVLQDKQFVAKGNGTASLMYTPGAPVWVPEFFGDVALVNGKAWPNLNVDAGIYRFRVVNGSQARFYNLSLSNGGLIYQIGTDSGLLDAPVALTSLLIAPGERADILLDFTGSEGARIILQNNAPAPFPAGKKAARAGGVPLPDIMQFTVGATPGAFTVLPTSLRGGATQPPAIVPLRNYAPGSANNLVAKRRILLLFEVLGPAGTPVLATQNILRFEESLNSVNAITGNNAVIANTLEQWDIVNMTADAHPIHLHLAQFQLLRRRNFNTTQYMRALNALTTRTISATNNLVTVPDLGANAVPDPTPFLTGPVFQPAANELGWKDTIQVNTGQVTSILVPFGSQALGGAAGIPFGTDNTFTVGPSDSPYVWHCHILDHEENDMMSSYIVV